MLLEAVPADKKYARPEPPESRLVNSWPRPILSRYLNPEVLNRLAGRRIDPRGLVLGNLAGTHKSPLSGFAVEFAGHREYTWGDDPKHIDWRVYFTRDRYFVKQYEMETNFVCHFILDGSASMRYGQGPQQKLAYAAQMIAALGYAVIHQSDKASLATFDERDPRHRAAQQLDGPDRPHGRTPGRHGAACARPTWPSAWPNWPAG